jgi:UDP-N-acetylmuramyl pentapeptide phosphotransferase/UDP-N-acetylglucosamine-1-phosphate transferase
MILLPAAIALALSWLAIRFLLAHAARLPQDHPNARSLHARAVPRAGGWAIWAGWLAGTLWLPEPRPWLGPLLALVAVSALDDRRGVHPLLRLVVHVAAASLCVWLAGWAVQPLVAVTLIVWMANLYNFMDGSDGLAAAMSLIGFASYAAAAWLAGAGSAVPLAALAAATVPFLLHNLPPARIFLGDAGSVPLGFLAAVFGITGWIERWWPAWFPVLVFLPFVGDASVTLALRAVRGARLWEPHREHCYQRLVRLGWGHERTLMLYAGLMLGTAGSALWALVWAPSAGLPALGVWAFALGSLFALTEYHWRRRGAQFEESKG